MLEAVHREFNIKDKLTLTTTDNGSNFIKAFSIFTEVQRSIQEYRAEEEEEEDDEDEEDQPVFINLTEILAETQEDYSLPPHQRCACHSLNLVATRDIEHALTQSETFKRLSRSTLAKCQALWNKQHRSTQASDTIQEKLGCQLIVPILTRWNSTYHAMERLNTCILTKEQEFYEVCEKLQVARFKSTEFTFIQEYVKVMTPLAKALDVLQSDRMGFSGVLVPTISILLERMEEMKRECRLHHCNPMVDAIISGIKKRFEYIFQDTRLLRASATHPMFRLTYIPSDKKAQVVSDLKVEVHLLQTQPSGHRQTEDDNLADYVDEVTGYFPSLRSATELNVVDTLTWLQTPGPLSLPVLKYLPDLPWASCMFSGAATSGTLWATPTASCWQPTGWILPPSLAVD
ncbi:uncharacterized protein LOC119788482 [Cyprinodon tularosa]|uniref:uncharacterized protein LOC119788482 n=1 Tax=Cyprinodon tularosa TaxID=77115 RepID=UPI0018E266EA|nr:uncharacterized protein LOC119788482 [Cyprinodon tularosa]